MQPLFSDFATRQLKPWLLSAEHSPEIITLHNSSRSPARKVIWETAYQGGFGNCAAYRWKIATELRPCRWQNVSLTQNLVFATLETRRELKPKSSRNCLWDFGQFFLSSPVTVPQVFAFVFVLTRPSFLLVFQKWRIWQQPGSRQFMHWY